MPALRNEYGSMKTEKKERGCKDIDSENKGNLETLLAHLGSLRFSNSLGFIK